VIETAIGENNVPTTIEGRTAFPGCGPRRTHLSFAAISASRDRPRKPGQTAHRSHLRTSPTSWQVSGTAMINSEKRFVEFRAAQRARARPGERDDDAEKGHPTQRLSFHPATTTMERGSRKRVRAKKSLGISGPVVIGVIYICCPD